MFNCAANKQFQGEFLRENFNACIVFRTKPARSKSTDNTVTYA